jgi:hypothetical protein
MSVTPYNLFLELNKKVPAIIRRYDADAVGDALIKVLTKTSLSQN